MNKPSFCLISHRSISSSPSLRLPMSCAIDCQSAICFKQCTLDSNVRRVMKSNAWVLSNIICESLAAKRADSTEAAKNEGTRLYRTARDFIVFTVYHRWKRFPRDSSSVGSHFQKKIFWGFEPPTSSFLSYHSGTGLGSLYVVTPASHLCIAALLETSLFCRLHRWKRVPRASSSAVYALRAKFILCVKSKHNSTMINWYCISLFSL